MHILPQFLKNLNTFSIWEFKSKTGWKLKPFGGMKKQVVQQQTLTWHLER